MEGGGGGAGGSRWTNREDSEEEELELELECQQLFTGNVEVMRRILESRCDGRIIITK